MFVEEDELERDKQLKIRASVLESRKRLKWTTLVIF